MSYIVNFQQMATLTNREALIKTNLLNSVCCSLDRWTVCFAQADVNNCLRCMRIKRYAFVFIFEREKFD